MEIVGWIGSVLFAICAFPQALQVYRDGHAKGLNWFFLLAWFFGEIFTMAYVLPKGDIPLISNYVVNIGFLGVILYFKINPRAKK
jgi:uncharacterized protein with PQ loop repeat